MSNIIFTQGSVEVVIPSAESIAVYSAGTAQVFREVGFPNVPSVKNLEGTVSNGTTVFGPYASGATIIIEAGAAGALYEVGTDPVIASTKASQVQGAPVAVNVTGAVSAAAILGGIVTSTTAAAVAGTVPTGTVMDLASEFAIGDSFDWSVINTGGTNAFTVTAAAGHTLVGAAVVALSSSGLFRTRKTAVDTFVTYRMS